MTAQDKDGLTYATMKAELQLAHFLFELIWQPENFTKLPKEMETRSLQWLLHWQHRRWDSDYDSLKELSKWKSEMEEMGSVRDA